MRTLFHNGSIYGSPHPAASAFVVDGADLAWTGSQDEARSLAVDVDRVVDLDGCLVTPGFVDAHVHVTETGIALTGVDVAGARSVAQILQRVERASRAGRGRPVLGFGWDERLLEERRPPTRQELDRASAGGVVYLARVDGHSAVVSSALAAAASATTLPGFGTDGRVERDAHHAVRDATRTGLTGSQREHLQRRALEAAAACGIVAVHEMSAPHLAPEDDLHALLALVDAAGGDLPDVVAYRGELAQDSQSALRIRSAYGGRLRGLAGDLSADGSVGSRTAAYREPYADDPSTCGHLYISAEQVREHVLATSAVGLQAGFHVIGDAAADAVLEGFAQAGQRQMGAPRAGALRAGALRAGGHRLEHVESVDDGAIAAMARLGLTASVQPAFDASWGGTGGMYAQRLGERRALSMNPFGTLAARGVRLALGSDSPVTAFDPWGAVRACVFHHVAEQRLSAEDAFLAHTSGGWQAAGEAVPGGLRAGGQATFAAWEVGGGQRGRGSAASLPDLRPGEPLPQCRLTVLRGRELFSTF